ncbi:ABC transporter substrate-binding protein [Bradyrhizobium sp. 49]|uniref:ABC transporter substrate-binding protein n=1 Tax=unclassified Bradyrhizobium TaxID=2631580 RepID=UPI001FF812D6|nr:MULTISPECIES: ABC transporter substrate-binding protein [unclassified Bradyrhizobium]MCK1268007.1 ABC transporter substrate-binding protein [Bradyrhizobium sp. 84]MCK1370344.1 ABC transporter substrate-binding protein [Bradyrhizobium sp. 49]
MRTSLRVASALAIIGLAASILTPAKPAFAGDQLTITSGGGALQAGQRKALFEPFSKATGIKITEDEYNYDTAKIRAMVESKTVSWDVILIPASAAVRLCDEGILETIDWKKLGLDQSKFMGADKSDCAVPISVSATVIAYDKDKLANGPKTIADFFDLQKFPGKRGLLKDPYANLEWALIADGVPIKDVYKLLNTPEGVDRAFKKLDTIKKDVVWWTSGAQPPQLLADGQVIMTAAYNGRIYDAVKNSGKHFEVMWDAAVIDFASWAIPKGDPRLDDAYKFIAFASSAQAQADFARYVPYGPANRDGLALVDPVILPHLPTAPDHMGIEADPAFWADKMNDLRQRFTAWIAK